MGKNRKLFLTDFCVTPMEKIISCGILCERGNILAIGGASAFSLMEDGLEIIRIPKCYAIPGLIDSHIHGISYFDAAGICENENVLAQMGGEVVKHGITSFCPTLASRPKEEMLKIISKLAEAIEKGGLPADVPGIHLEGPFLNPEKRGSQDERWICSQIDLGYARELLHAGNGKIKLFTFAPELEGAEKLIELMMLHGAIPSMGHSLANEEQTLRCIDAGAQRCTYIFNGMPQLYHRESSLTSVALTDDRVSVEIISDGTHVHPCFVNMAARCKPHDKIIGISNNIALTNGAETKDGVITTKDGILAGTTMPLEKSWAQLASFARIQPRLAAECFTRNPAINLGLITRGELLPGKRADISFFDIKTRAVRMTVVRGEIKYDARNAER